MTYCRWYFFKNPPYYFWNFIFCCKPPTREVLWGVFVWLPTVLVGENLVFFERRGNHWPCTIRKASMRWPAFKRYCLMKRPAELPHRCEADSIKGRMKPPSTVSNSELAEDVFSFSFFPGENFFSITRKSGKNFKFSRFYQVKTLILRFQVDLY